MNHPGGERWSLPEQLDAVVLGGGDNRGALRQASSEPYEALIPIGSEPMIAHVAAALSRARRVGRIVCVGPAAVLEAAAEALARHGARERLAPVGPGRNLLENLERGLAESQSPYAVVVTSDIPLVRAHMVDDFIERCEQAPEAQDVWYAVVERAVGEARYPGVRRTWIRLADGTFTGGNLAVVERRIVEKTRRLLDLAIRGRKNPLALARLLGPGALWRFLWGRLTVAEAERQVGRILGIKGRAVVTPYPEIGIDVDKPADLLLARRHLVPGRSSAG